MILLLLVLLAAPACERPLFDTPRRKNPSSDRSTPPPSPRDTVKKEEENAVYATAFVFPDSVDWRGGDTQGGKLVLFKNKKAVGSLPAGNRPTPNGHRFLNGHLWTDNTDGATTIVYRDGSPVFSFPGQETLVGFLVADGRVHTLGQRPGGGLCYRIDGQEAFSSAQGTVLGTLYLDGSDVCYAYTLPVLGADEETLWEYRVMQGDRPLMSVPARVGVTTHDIRVHDGEVYRLEYHYSQACLLKGETLWKLDLPSNSQDLRLTVCNGKVLVKGTNRKGRFLYCWVRDKDDIRYDYLSSLTNVFDFYVDGDKLTAVLLDGENRVVKVVKGEGSIDVPRESYRLHTSRCVAFGEEKMGLALTGDTAENENSLMIDGELIPVPFNGYFTGIYF